MAMYENIESLDKEIERLTSTISTLKPTSEEYKIVRINLDTLYKLRNEQYKVDVEDIEKRSKREADTQQNAEELEVRKQELAAAQARFEAESRQKAEELDVRRQELALAEKRLEAERLQKAEENDLRTYELQLSEKQHADEIKAQKANRIHDGIVTGVKVFEGVAKLLMTIGFGLIVAHRGYKFEETGCPTSPTFKMDLKNAVDMVKDTFKK